MQGLIRLAARWFVRNRRGHLDVRAEVEFFAPKVRAIQLGMQELVHGEQKAAWERRHHDLQDAGISGEVALALEGSTMLIGALGMVSVARTQELAEEVGARVAFAWNEGRGLDRGDDQ